MLANNALYIPERADRAERERERIIDMFESIVKHGY